MHSNAGRVITAFNNDLATSTISCYSLGSATGSICYVTILQGHNGTTSTAGSLSTGVTVQVDSNVTGRHALSVGSLQVDNNIDILIEGYSVPISRGVESILGSLVSLGGSTISTGNSYRPSRGHHSICAAPTILSINAVPFNNIALGSYEATGESVND